MKKKKNPKATIDRFLREKNNLITNFSNKISKCKLHIIETMLIRILDKNLNSERYKAHYIVRYIVSINLLIFTNQFKK